MFFSCSLGTPFPPTIPGLTTLIWHEKSWLCCLFKNTYLVHTGTYYSNCPYNNDVWDSNKVLPRSAGSIIFWRSIGTTQSVCLFFFCVSVCQSICTNHNLMPHRNEFMKLHRNDFHGPRTCHDLEARSCFKSQGYSKWNHVFGICGIKLRGHMGRVIRPSQRIVVLCNTNWVCRVLVPYFQGWGSNPGWVWQKKNR